MIKVALVDDHALLRGGLASVINSFGEYEVIFEADNGKQFIELLHIQDLPDIVLLDVTMPEMNGFETAAWLKKNQPKIKVLVLSMMDDDQSIIKMLRNGAKGYILKDSKPDILKTALDAVAQKGFFMNETVSGKLIHLANKKETEENAAVFLNEREKEFLRMCCSEKSYKEIADNMSISPRTVEAMRSKLFEAFGTLSRVGLVLYSIKNGIVTI